MTSLLDYHQFFFTWINFRFKSMGLDVCAFAWMDKYIVEEVTTQNQAFWWFRAYNGEGIHPTGGYKRVYDSGVDECFAQSIQSKDI